MRNAAEASGTTPHAGWRSRGDLPHFDSPETVQHVVFRLADAIPGPVIDRLERVPAAERPDGVAEALRRGHGDRRLAVTRLAGVVEAALLHFDSVNRKASSQDAWTSRNSSTSTAKPKDPAASRTGRAPRDSARRRCRRPWRPTHPIRRLS